MFQITSLTIKNMGRHKLIQIDLRGVSLYGFFGPNGAGKSTILQAIELALTGTIVHEDSPAAFVRRTEEVTDGKHNQGLEVELGFLSDGKPGKITRTISLAGKGGRTLEWDGATPVNKAAEVDRMLLEMLGADKKALSSTVFIPQGTLDKIFAADDIDRRELYGRLMVLSEYEKISAKAEVFRQEVAASLTDLGPSRDQAEAQRQEAQTQWIAAQEVFDTMVDPGSELEIFQKLAMSSRALDQLQRETDTETEAGKHLVEAWNAGTYTNDVARTLQDVETQCATEIDERTLKLQVASDHLHRMQGRVFEHDQALVKVTGFVKALGHRAAHEKATLELAALPPLREDLAAAASVRIPVLYAAVQAHSWIPDLKLEVTRLEQELQKANSELTPPEEIERIDGQYREASLRTVRARADEAQFRTLMAAVGSPGSCCPVCGSATPDAKFLTRKLAEAETEAAAAQAEYLKAKGAWETISQQAAAGKLRVTNAQSDLEKCARKLEEANGKLAGTKDGVEAQAEYDRAQAEVREVNQQRDARTRLTTQIEFDRRQFLDADTEVELALAQEDLAQKAQTIQTDQTMKPILEQNKVRVEGEIVALRAQRDGVKLRISAQESLARRLAEALTTADVLLSELPAISRAKITMGGVGGVIVNSLIPEVQAGLMEEQRAYHAQSGVVSQAKRALSDADGRVTELDLRIEEQQVRRTIAAELKLVVEAFKPQGVTLEYLHYQFARVAEMTQDYLTQLQVDFTVTASETRPLAFDFIRLSEPAASWLPQSRMSGGQRVALAIAILLSIHELVIPQVGLLVIDEPSLHLDAESAESLAEIFVKLGRTEGRQIIFCDHNPVLLRAAGANMMRIGA